MTIQDIHATTSRAIIDATIHDEIQHDLKNIKSDEFVLSVYFGKNIVKKHNPFAAKLHGLFPVPIFNVTFVRKKVWLIKKIHILSINEIPEAHKEFFIEAAKEYFCVNGFIWRA